MNSLFYILCYTSAHYSKEIAKSMLQLLMPQKKVTVSHHRVVFIPENVNDLENQ